ncbi:MAG: 5-formyltetrahydrofolate cyclo-ligase [Clostridium sp.]|nr:5-formyltetrahydrofolate cyclo-ligase [Clostridium sp.]
MLEKQKAELRNTIRQQLKALPEKEKEVLDREIAKRVLELADIGNGIVFAYASLSWEAGTDKILEALWKEKKTVFLPKVSGKTMEFFLTGSKEDLEEGTFHIMEPKAGCRSADETAAEATKMGAQSLAGIASAPILIPGMAFTERGSRLGKGGGYYDRYLEKNRNHKTIAIAYEFQIIKDLPAGPLDQNVDMIVTERRVIRCD